MSFPCPRAFVWLYRSDVDNSNLNYRHLSPYINIEAGLFFYTLLDIGSARLAILVKPTGLVNEGMTASQLQGAGSNDK